MTPYWVLFGTWAVGAIQFARPRQHSFERLFYVVAATLTALMIGFRYQVGGDWGAYLATYQMILFQPLGPALGQTDPGYALLNWMASRDDWGIWFVNLGCAALFMAGLARLASHQPNPWLAMLVAVPYLIIVVAMGYTRQAAAIGVICWLLADAAPDRLVRVVLLIGLAALFHKTAILFLPLLVAPVATRNPLIGIIGAMVFAALAVFFLGDTSDQLITNYATSDYNSQGAGIRIAMNVLAAGLLLIFRERMGFSDYLKRFWSICAMLAVASVGALLLLSASSGVDRMSLFLIPLQVVTLSRLPYALSSTGRPLPSLVLGVTAYSLAVQFVWLNYADNSRYWLPYRTTLAADSD